MEEYRRKSIATRLNKSIATRINKTIATRITNRIAMPITILETKMFDAIVEARVATIAWLHVSCLSHLDIFKKDKYLLLNDLSRIR